ncbi:MAG: MarR family transcriptional regulator [Myxococcaceae bacterium]|nr:MarR family transcriptional regulator [Myxococcaceae bacterium]
MPDDYLRLDQQICFALYRASRAIIRAYGPLLEPLGLTYLQYLVLLVLWEEDGVPVRHLGERLSLDSATLTPLLKNLENDGVVTRARDEADQRVVRIALTEKGRGLKAKARKVPKEVGCLLGMVDAPSAARLGKLKEQLNALSAQLEA